MGSKPTIRDVSRLAGVSTATVSYVLNNTPGKSISPETAERVRAAAAELSYISNSAARNLQSGRVGCVGVVINQSLSLSRYANTLQGIVVTLQQENIQVLLCDMLPVPGSNSPYPAYLNAWLSGQVDGVIFIGAEGIRIPEEVERFIVERQIPFVACDCEASRYISAVDIDYLSGAYDITRFLLGKGIKKVFYFRPEITIRQESEREMGVRRAIYEHGGCELELHTFPNIAMWSSFNTDSPLMQEIYSSTMPGSAYIGSWSGCDQPLVHLALQQPFEVPVATLAQGNIFQDLFPHLYYNYIPTFDLGRVCAAEILRLIENPADIRHELLGCTTPLDPEAYQKMPYFAFAHYDTAKRDPAHQ